MNILDRIVTRKRLDVAEFKKNTSEQILRAKPQFDREKISFKRSLTTPGASGIIAEFKRRSPSKGVLNNTALIGDVVTQYEEAGASGLSILTDEEGFGGSILDIENVRHLTTLPILRKEFIVDPVQIYETKAIGGDAILLIAAILSSEEIEQFSRISHEIGLEVLLEVHTEDEIEKSPMEFIDMIGVNNRDLRDFSVSIERSLQLVEHLPSGKIPISESGLNSPKDIAKLFHAGFRGFLIGESFIASSDPGAACAAFISALPMRRL